MERYLEINGKYHYEDHDNSTTVMDEVAICFDTDSDMLLDHGDPERLLEYYEESIDNFKEMEWEEAIGDIILVIAKFPIRELNKLMLNRGYLSGFIKNNKELFARDMVKDE